MKKVRSKKTISRFLNESCSFCLKQNITDEVELVVFSVSNKPEMPLNLWFLARPDFFSMRYNGKKKKAIRFVVGAKWIQICHDCLVAAHEESASG